MRRLLAFFFLFILFSACNTERAPDGVIPEDKMVKVLTDIHIADGYTSTMDNYRDSLQIASVYKAVFNKHNTDSTQIRKSLEFYSRSPKRLQNIYKEVDKQLLSIQKQEEKREQERIKQEQKREKLRLQALKKKEKLRLDSLKRDSLKKVTLKRDSLKRDSLKRDSIKRRGGIRKEENKQNDIPTKRNR